MRSKPSRRLPRKTGQSGFTLIELLVALGVTVVGLAGLLSLHLALMKGNRTAANTAEATTVAQESMEELRSQAVSAITTKYGTIPIVDVLMDPLPPGRTGLTYTRTLTVRQVTGNLLWIQVRVAWTDDGADPATVDEQYRHEISFEVLRTSLEDQ